MYLNQVDRNINDDFKKNWGVVDVPHQKPSNKPQVEEADRRRHLPAASIYKPWMIMMIDDHELKMKRIKSESDEIESGDGRLKKAPTGSSHKPVKRLS